MYLTDQPSCVDLARRDPLAPRYQYSYRDVISGAIFLGYARELSEAHAKAFVDSILTRYRLHGMSPENMLIQTDNGSEFSGSRKMPWERDGFHYAVTSTHGARHRYIPPGCSNANGGVESFHHLIQREFFSAVRFETTDSFWKMTSAYQHYFNFGRFCLSKGAKTPRDILSPACPQADRLLFTSPVDLDALVYRRRSTANYLPRMVGPEDPAVYGARRIGPIQPDSTWDVGSLDESQGS